MELLAGLVVCVVLFATVIKKRPGIAVGAVVMAVAFVLGAILFPGGRFYIFGSGVGL